VVAAHHKLATYEKKMSSGDRGEAEAWKRYDAAFHNALISACGSGLLLEMHRTIYDKYLRYLVLADVYRGQATVNEHRKLMQLAIARDWKSAQRVLIKHIEDCVAYIVDKGLAIERVQ
jgi:DNA-binding GntR family transcriptional regulator